MNIVLTGKMKFTRSEETSRFKKYGINVQSGVRNNTDFLVTGENPGGTKLEAADFKGVTVLTEDDFFDHLIEEYPEYLL